MTPVGVVDRRLRTANLEPSSSFGTITRMRPARGRVTTMAPLTLFGLFAVTLMLVCYAFEYRSPRWILGFAVACALGSIYGFLQGAWPFGVVEAVWSVVALRRWWSVRASAADALTR